MIGKKYISAILLICFSVLIGHSVIPHHHHHDLGSGHTCPMEQDNRSSDKHSNHCHAFNDLAFFKTNTATAPTTSFPIEFIAVIQDLEPIIPQLVAGFHILFKIPDPSVEADVYLLLRGPPAIA